MSQIQPLLFPTKAKNDVKQEEEVSCLFCFRVFRYKFESELQNLQRHLLLDHKFVISNIKNIPDIMGYFEYWRPKFKNANIEDICAVIKTNSSNEDADQSEFYYLLPDTLPEDKEIRCKLWNARLEVILLQQQKERSEKSFSRMCLYCRKIFTENRAFLLDHMAHDHNFSVGRPDNLVFVDELLDVLEEKLKNFYCLYCERKFKDWNVLKEHMRKKQHKQINPNNKFFDKFYVNNYVEPQLKEDRSPEDKQENACNLDIVHDEREWKDWNEDDDSLLICLFCENNTHNLKELFDHMKNVHQFDFIKLKTEMNLNFYQQVKLVNYIRKKVYLKQCVICGEECLTPENLMSHLSQYEEVIIEEHLWDQPQYYFPTYENDHLLFALDDEDDDTNTSQSSEEAFVFPEDPFTAAESILKDLSLHDSPADEVK